MLFAAALVALPAGAQQPQLQWRPQLLDAPMLTLGLKPADALFPIGLAQARPVSLASRPRFADWLARNWAFTPDLNNAGVIKSTSTDNISFLPPPPVSSVKAARDTASPGPGVLGGQLGQYADIGMMIRGHGELGGAWNRYSPCDPTLQLSCKPSLFPQLRPDVTFGVLVGGTISDRVHVNVDYDQTREFDAANNLNVYYQGLEDEVLQRLEVGDVSIRLPASRYLTQGIPTGNFGFKATGQLGPIEFQSVYAQQRGDVTTREFRLGGTGNTSGLVQDETLSLDDAEYIKGQFFFLTDPDSIAGAPHVNAVTLRASDARASLRPAAGSVIEVYRDERPSAINQQQQAQLGYFLADAYMPDNSRKHSGLFKRLQQGKDYVLHPSGLWIMLRSPLRTDEALAVSYVTETGDTVGTPRAEAVPPGTTPRLRLIRGPASIHQPNFPTWRYEFHNVYRVHSSSTVDLSSIQLTLSFGQSSAGRTFANTISGQVPYLRLFGLDEDAPVNALDVAQVYQPGQDLGGFPSSTSTSSTAAPIVGTYIIFRTLRPFFEPGPVPSAHLTAADARLALGSEANSAIYNDLDPITRAGSARFRLNFQYRVRVEGLITSFNLGAFGIRDGSDKILIGDRVLMRGTDYTIDYDIGAVTLMDPQTLFATNPGAQIRATWEQKSQFQIAPTSVFGTNARYQLGTRGELNFVGLYQAEKTIMTRPQLGVEPSSIFLGGTSGHLDLGGALLDRALSHLPGLRFGGTSALTLNGEMALSMPNPNRRNQAYVEDFEGSDALTVSPVRRSWFLGSRPQDLSGSDNYLPPVLLTTNAAQLVWQNDILGTNGTTVGGEFPSNIDKQIRIAGAERLEDVMLLTLGDQAHPVPGKRWRSMTTPLSTTAIDLSRSEYLELYVKTSEDKGKALIIDIGTVGEDAFYFDAQGKTNGQYTDGARWGLGELDSEARLSQREIWGPDKDARGLWDQPCKGTGINPPPQGDVSANCARSNGLLDTEDLDGNGLLDSDDGSYYRYVVPLDRISQYLVRDKSQTGTLYQLYRIPLREGTSIGGATAASWRFVKHLRLTFTSNTDRPVDQAYVARMHIVGSHWVKRDLDGVSSGLLSDRKGISAGTATIEVGPVGSLTEGADYQSPPAVLEELQDPTQGIGANSVEFNEKGLRIRYNNLGGKERAEVYYRYAQQPRSFLNYRQLQMWAVAKRGNYGPTGNQKLVIKVGTDARNYYLYQTKLTAAVGERGVTTTDWQPQIVIDFNKWFELKGKAELALLNRTLQPPAPGEPYVLYSEDSTYAIVLEDRARGPNLAAVRELSFGLYNGSATSAQGEVWLNDMRLASPFRDNGSAANLSVDLRGGDFLSGNFSFARQGALFRQLNQDASYLGAGDYSFNTGAQLGQMLPASWGVELPITVSHAHTAQDPTLLESSDVQAARLVGLRKIGSNATRLGVSIRKRTPSANPLLSAIVDGTTLRFGYSKGQSSAITMHNEVSGMDGALTYMHEIKNADVDVVPGFLEAFLRLLAPKSVENGAFFQHLAGARLRYTPVRLSFSSTYFKQEQRAFQFNNILVTDSDAIVKPIESPRRTLDTDATLALQPFKTLTGDITLRSSRDLLSSTRASTRPLEQQAIADAHGGIAGLDMGWETYRSLTSQLNFKPVVADWLQPSVTYTSRFGTDRSPSYLEIITVGADTTAILQRRFQADRQLQRQLLVQPSGFFTSLVHDTTGLGGLITRGLRALQPVNLSWYSTLGSQFDRNHATPDFAYQLALGDLERFRAMGIDSAQSATETGRFDATTSVRFLRSAQMDFQYSTADLQAFDQRGGTRTEKAQTWPDVRLNWNDMPLPNFVRAALQTMTMSANYQHKRRTQALGFGGLSDRGGRETLLPVTARFLFRGGISASYTGTRTSGQSDDPTGNAEQSGMNHNVNVSVAFKPPGSLAEKLKQPLRISLALTQNRQQQCRFRPAVEGTVSDCVSFIDFRNRTANFTLDTVIQDLIVGVQMGYNGHQDFVGTLRGSSQFQLAVFANFELPVGQLPGGMGMGQGVRR